MPSAFAHAVVGASFAAVLPPGARRTPVALALALLAAAPDLDVIAFRFGIPYEHSLGHRGLSHSILFAAAVGLGSLPLWRLAKISRTRLAAALTFCAVASHGLLDTFTDAGLGVGLFIPLADTRYFAPLRPLMTSPLSAGAFFSSHGLAILQNELIWVGPVALLSGLIGLAIRRAMRGSVT